VSVPLSRITLDENLSIGHQLFFGDKIQVLMSSSTLVCRVVRITSLHSLGFLRSQYHTMELDHLSVANCQPWPRANCHSSNIWYQINSGQFRSHEIKISVIILVLLSAPRLAAAHPPKYNRKTLMSTDKHAHA
jgi:hypothetical protein